jgi:hypothetical protein
MDGQNLNEIMKMDPSFRGGDYNKVFERKCPIEMKIIEKSIIDMVGQQISSQENLQCKVMVKNQDKRDTEKNSGSSSIQPDILRLEIMSDNDYFF